LKNLLLRFGITISQDNLTSTKYCFCDGDGFYSSFLKSGSKIDVTVSSIGDASSLQGGVLLLTPLSLSNGNVMEPHKTHLGWGV
jgi:flagellar P-ring protein precursor FlgI